MCLVQLKEMFPNLPQAIIISMHQASLGGANASQESSSCSGVSQTLKMMTQGPARHQVLVPLDSATAELIVANATSAVLSCNKSLVEFVYKTWNGMSISTNSVVSAAELEVIKQWLKKTAGLGESTEVEPRLPQSKSFLKVLGVLFFFLNHQFVTWCSIAACGRLSTTSSLQFWPQENKTPLIGREIQLESIEIKEKSK